MRWTGLFAGLLAAGAAGAAEHDRAADWTATCNAHGAVVEVANGPTYYLGKSCDAARPGGGTGRWYWAASRFVIEIDGEVVSFVGEPDCDLPYCEP